MSVPLTLDLVGKTIQFETQAPAILGSIVKNVKVLGFLDPGSAKGVIDIFAKHAEVYPYLPSGVAADSATSYSYLKVQQADGTFTVYGLPWIKQDTVNIITQTNIVATIKGKNAMDVDKVRVALLAQGFDAEDLDIQVVSS